MMSSYYFLHFRNFPPSFSSFSVSTFFPRRHDRNFRCQSNGRYYSTSCAKSSSVISCWKWQQQHYRLNSRGVFSTIAVPPDENNSRCNMCQLFRDIALRLKRRRDYIGGFVSNPISTNHPMTHKDIVKSATSLTSEFCMAYLSIPEGHISSSDSKQMLFKQLIQDEYYVDTDAITSVVRNIQQRVLRDGDIQRMHNLTTPLYELLFSYILGSAQQDLGVPFFVRLRRDVRDFIQFIKFVPEKVEQNDDDENQLLHAQLARLTMIDRSIQNTLSILFRPGVLELRRITYNETPAGIVEQIAFKEAVHPLTSLKDLRTRLGPGRRCFAFFHPSLPNKPLAFVHVTLLKEIPKSMTDLTFSSEESEPNVLTFYSITNTEPGLAGIDLGNHLIKSVVQVMQKEFPKVHTFCTLSPLPKFRNWLDTKIAQQRTRFESMQNPEAQEVSNHKDVMMFSQSELQLLDMCNNVKSLIRFTSHEASNTSIEGFDTSLLVQVQPLLMKLAAHYLTIEKNHQRPLCSVAKFHTRNGAEIYRLNFMADLSQKGMRNSYGIMVNYRYVLDEIEENSFRHEVYGDIVVNDAVNCWLNE